MPNSPNTNNTNDKREEDYRRLFKKLDTKNSGYLTNSNIDYEKLRKYTPYPDKFIELADHDKDGIIKEDEFVKYCRENEKNIISIFDEIDTKNDGLLDKVELRRAFTKANIEFTEEQLNRTINQLDKTGDKQVEKADWVWHYILVHGKHKEDFLQMAYENTHDRLLHGVQKDIPVKFSWEQFLWSFPGPAIAKTASAPFDRMKIFYQVYSDRWNLHEKGRMKLSTCAKMLYSEGGIKGMFRGNGVNVIKSMPEQAIKLNCNKYIRQHFDKINNPYPINTNICKSSSKSASNKTTTRITLPIHQEIVAAGLSGLVAQTSVYPLDTLKIRMALARTNEYSGPYQAIRKIYNEPTSKPLQICNFYRGFFSSLGVIVYVAAELTVFNGLLPKCRAFCKDINISPHVGSATAGFLAPATGTIISYPLQLIRTRYQSDQRPHFGYSRFCYNTYKNLGVKGFYTGLMPNLAKSIISGSIILTWWSYVEGRMK